MAVWSTTSAAAEIRMDSMLQDLRYAPTFVGVTLILARSSATAVWLPTARCEWTPSWRCAMRDRRA